MAASQQLVFFVSGVVGFGPSVAVLFHALRTYDYPYTEKAYFDTRRVFFGLAVAMVLGTISSAITVWLRGGMGGSLAALVILLLLVALFEEGFKLVYLNRKGYRGRFDTTFVGVTVGVGIAAIAAAGSAYVNGPDLLSAPILATLAVFSTGLGFVHVSTGALIGYGCAKGEVLAAFGRAYAARAIHSAILVPFFVWSALPNPSAELALPLYSLAASVAFTVVLYAYVYRSVLPATLPPELRRERRRRVRRAGAAKE